MIHKMRVLPSMAAACQKNNFPHQMLLLVSARPGCKRFLTEEKGARAPPSSIFPICFDQLGSLVLMVASYFCN